MRVVSALRVVDHVFLAVDTDSSVCQSIYKIVEKIRLKYGDEVKIIFGKGGDRFVGNIPEVAVCKELGVEIRDGLGDKTHSSSDFRVEGF